MLTELTLIGLAAWRLALFLDDDSGPFGFATRLRIFVRADQVANAIRSKKMWHSGDPLNGWEKLWSCMRCMTFWTALGLYGVWQLEDRVVLVLAAWAWPRLSNSYATANNSRGH